ncbi:uncharacterized protein LOC132701737 [Cylas formicarius]|uniref:uncharacterized protein LOC132701737 n=1 Tax=Cylas formicarius TaxID=197179 RepID=UPI002958D406|nr:uncharacterized protein LOC132701737 [Cylas formicarius]
MSGTGEYSIDTSYFNKPPPSIYRRSETSNPWNRPTSKTSYPSYQNAQDSSVMPPPPILGPSTARRATSSRSSYGSNRNYNTHYKGLSQYGSTASDNGYGNSAARYSTHRYTSVSSSYTSQSSPSSTTTRSYNNSTSVTNMYTTPPPSAAVVPVQYPPPPPPPPPPPALPTCTSGVEHSTNVPPPTQYAMAQMVYGTYSVPQVPVDFRAYQNDYMFGNMYQPVTNGYNRNRRVSTDGDPSQKKPKRKKPLSQNIPVRKEWAVEDARRALEVEKEFNKRQKSQSLIIKFPDIEVNREIVRKFNPKIDTVHFQQPSTPRFCFVSLSEGANADDVIKELNQTPFGSGYLIAEHKKDREDEINIGPEDIDPLTLYVGNLAQEITIEDMYKAYPKRKRVDIGYAKKMKFTRYAFVLFHNVEDAIEAFQNTFASEMHSKSIIVRFRRLHGTVGLPGEPKPQNPPKRTEDRRTDDSNTNLVDMEVDAPREDAGETTRKTETDDRRIVQLPQILDDEFKSEFKGEMEDDEESDSCDERDQPLPEIFYSNNSTDAVEGVSESNDDRVEVKKEPRDEYWAEPAIGDEVHENKRIKVEEQDQSFFQPVMEQIHRPMLEPKKETVKETQPQLELPIMEVKKEEYETDKDDDEDSSDDGGGVDFDSIMNALDRPHF